MKALVLSFTFLLFSAPCIAEAPIESMDLTSTSIGLMCVFLFLGAYLLVILEEKLKLRKSKPVLFSAGVIWALIGYQFSQLNHSDLARQSLEHNFLEYTELFLFLLVAMTYINAMEERGVFNALKTKLLSLGVTFKSLFWITGILSFLISPIADNLTAALIMCTVVLKVASHNRVFINLCCINIVVAANAGGAFSPFGDITTLMVWQSGKVSFSEFFVLVLPSTINFILPALIMSFFLPQGKPNVIDMPHYMKRGSKRIMGLFLLTICGAIYLHIAFEYPPVIGMMLGLAYLQLFGFYLRKTLPKYVAKKLSQTSESQNPSHIKRYRDAIPFDIFQRISEAEWDTLLFFYGVVMSVGGLSLLGYLSLASDFMYNGWSPLWANIFVGLLSALVDNIPVMYAVISMDPDMSLGHWLLVTLTAGVGGSLLSIGSAAGVALMGASKGHYTFGSHLKWAPIIALGYTASIIAHLALNQTLF